MKCTKSPTGEHAYNTNNYTRDDQGFYLDCVYCGVTHFFEGYSLDEFFPNDDDDDIESMEEEE